MLMDEATKIETRDGHAILARLVQQCEQLNALVASDDLTLKQIERGVRTVRELLKDCEPLPTKRDREKITTQLKKIQESLYPRLHELRELDAWQRWANVGIQEELCSRVEALSKVQDPAEVMRQLRECVAAWKVAATVPDERAGELWQRFKAAHDQAYARCSTFFVQQAQERLNNLKSKEDLCERAEALAQSTDWMRTASKIVALQKQWKAVGPVPRKHAKVIWKRFRSACDQFFKHRKADLSKRKETWKENLQRKEKLCVEAETLADSKDIDASKVEFDRLKIEWKKIGSVKKVHSEALWQRLKTAGDRLVAQELEKEEAELSDKVARQEALCTELESMLPSQENTNRSVPDNLAESVQNVRARWQDIGTLRHRQAKTNTLRYHEAIKRLLVAFPTAFQGTALDSDETQRRMEQLCARIEGLLVDDEQAARAKLTPTELLAERWRDVMAHNTMGVSENPEIRRRAACEEVKKAQGEWGRLLTTFVEGEPELSQRFKNTCKKVLKESPVRKSSGKSRSKHKRSVS